MLHKTEQDEDAKSVSTKVTQTTKAASFITSAKRQMFRNKALKNNKKVQVQMCNIIVLEPQFSSFVICDQVHFLQSGQNFVSITDFHYNLINDRSRPVMIPRNCQAGSQILFSNAKKPGITTILQSVHKFPNDQSLPMLHFNITRYNPSQNQLCDSRDIFINYQQNLQPQFFITLQNSKKGLLISRSKQKKYEIWYINLMKGNKTKNPRHISMLKQNNLSIKQQKQKQKQCEFEKQFIYAHIQIIKQKIQLKKDQYIIKMINSQFGDAIIVATNFNIYQLEFQPSSIHLKSLDVFTKLAKLIDNIGHDQIKDICYVVDGLKIIFITKAGLLGFIQAQNIQFIRSVYQIIASSNKKQQSNLKSVHALIGKVAIQTQMSGLLLIKLSEGQIIFEKKIELPVNKDQIISYKINLLARHDELIIQRVRKQGKLVLQVLCKNLLSLGNQTTRIYNSILQQKPSKTGTSTQLTLQPPKISLSKSNRIGCILRENTITFYQINQELPSQKHPIEYLFSKVFFQKPISISMDPYGSNIVIVYKEFVRFYKFQYKDIIQYYTYNVRNVCYAGYTQSGQYILVAVDDLLYFINAFSFETERIMEAYGDIKNVFFFDCVLYIALKNKINKNSSQVLMLQTYLWSNKQQQYQQLKQQKVQPTQCYYTSSKSWVIVSNKQIIVYRIKPEIYEQKSNNPYQTTNKSNQISVSEPEVQISNKRKIKFMQQEEYPTCVTLSEEFGVILVGTNCGRLYQYLWPFTFQNQNQTHYTLTCSNSQLSKIVVGTSYEFLYLYCKNGNILKLAISQYVEGQEMPNIYVINKKTLYQGDLLKYQFANRQYLYQKYTTYQYEKIQQTNETIQQLQFILQKTKDDIQQNRTKAGEAHQIQINDIQDKKKKDMSSFKINISQTQSKYQADAQEIKQKIKQALQKFTQIKQKQKDQYEKTLLDLYAQGSRLKGIITQKNKEHTRQKDLYLIQNDKVIKKMREQGEKMQQNYKQKFASIKTTSSWFQNMQNVQLYEKLDQQLKQFKETVRNSINQQLQVQQQRKETLLGSNGYLNKQIINYKQRKDQFQALVMETNLQIDQLFSDQKQYSLKKKYLINQLQKKQRVIQQKQKELVKLISGTANMKNLKQTHQFQLKQYEHQFEPILQKLTIIQGNIQKMNGQILTEYLNKVQNQRLISQNRQKFENLKQLRKQQMINKLDSQRKIILFLAQLQMLLQDPLSLKIKDNLNILSSGQKLIINEQLLRQRVKNSKLLRLKQFIGKQIQQNQKRQVQMFKSSVEITRHYNQNTMLVRQFNNLKQLGKKLEAMVKQTELKLITARASINMETPRKKISSLGQSKKYSEKKLTPFQRHQRQFNEMFKGQLTTQTKLSKSGHSMSLLKSLIRDVQSTDSKYEKMQIVRERVKSFVNPQIRIRKTLLTQKTLLQHKKAEAQSEI